MYKEITSLHNPLIREIISIKEKSRSRKKSGLFLIEGKQEIDLALQGGYTLDKLLYCEEIIDSKNLDKYKKSNAEIIKISPEVYDRLAYRGSTQGVLALGKSKNLSLEEISLSNKNPLLLVAEAPEKPGNIGALLRTADAAKVDAVLIANPKTDIYNPNSIRSSVGCIFTTQIATGTTQEILKFLKNNDIAVYCAALSASKPYHTIDYTCSAAIVVGTESTGLSDTWLAGSTQNIIIPMLGQINSLNVSVSAAIVIFEAKRQRNFK